MKRLLALTLVLSATAQAAPVPIVFWHSMDGVSDLIARFAQEFNRSQGQYEVRPSSVGNYREAAAKLRTALKAGGAPALFQAEYTLFNDLGAAGAFVNLNSAENELPEALKADFYPAVWKAGEIGGVRYGLPWNVSTPVLFYNAGAFRRAGLAAPRTWTELEAAAVKLKGRSGKRPLVAVADAWSFEQNVLSRGAQLVVNGRPNFASPEAVAALSQLSRMVKVGTAQARTLDNVLGAAIDFSRGQNLMAAASIANWPDFAKLPFVELGAAPMPCEKVCAVPIGGANLAVVKGSSAQETAGALAFWRYLMEPARLTEWVGATAYMTPRRSVQASLGDYYARNPYRRAAYAQLDSAQPRPASPSYAEWQPLLERAMSQALNGALSPQAALEQAQAQALALK